MKNTYKNLKEEEEIKARNLKGPNH